MKKLPDNIVYSEERGWYAKSLPYGSNVSAPKIEVVDIAPWKRDGVRKVNERLSGKFEELRNEYERLLQELHWNELIYNSVFSFEPVIGGEYHLYKTETNYILSIISPIEWGNRLDKMEWIGTFRLRSDKGWELVK
jgi:hypothetical protein